MASEVFRREPLEENQPVDEGCRDNHHGPVGKDEKDDKGHLAYESAEEARGPQVDDENESIREKKSL